jgi:hypothetical protein
LTAARLHGRIFIDDRWGELPVVGSTSSKKTLEAVNTMTNERTNERTNEQTEGHKRAPQRRKVVLLAIGFAVLGVGARRRESGCSGLGRTALFRTDTTGESRLASFAYSESEMLNMTTDVHASFAAGGVGVARSVDVRLDSSSRMYLLSAGQAPFDQAYAPPWVFSCALDTVLDGCYGRSGFNALRRATVAEVPYDNADEGGARRVQLAYELLRPTGTIVRPWNEPVDDVRVQDVGICDVTIPWRTLSAQLNRAVFTTLIGTVPSTSTMDPPLELRDESFQFAYSGPVFNRSLGAATGDDGRPVVEDQIALRLSQVIRASQGPFLPEIIGAEQGILKPSLVRDASGANVVRFEGRIIASDPSLEYTPRFGPLTVFEAPGIAATLDKDLPPQLAAAINGQLVQIVDNAGGSRVFRCDTRLNGDALRDACLREFLTDPTGPVIADITRTQAFECMPWSSLSATQLQSSPKYRTAYCRLPNEAPPPAQTGFCAIRVSPRRVQVTPAGLQLVLLDASNAPDARFIRERVIEPLLASPDVVASCDTHRRWPGFPPPRSTLVGVGELSPDRTRETCNGAEGCRAYFLSNTFRTLPRPSCR